MLMGCLSTLVGDERLVCVGATVAEELPCVAHLAYLVEVQVGDDEGVLVARRLGDDLAARVAEVALAVELADVPRLLVADAVDGADEVAVGDGVRGLFELPEVFREARDRGRGVEDYLGAVQTQSARALGEVAVVAD